MKRTILLLIMAIGIITIVSCQKNEQISLPSSPFKVTIKGGVQDVNTKVTYTEDVSDEANKHYDFSWSGNDKLSLIINDGESGNTNNEFTATTAAKSSPLTGSVTSWTGSQNIYSVYPYNSTAYTLSGAGTAATATVSLSMANKSVAAGNACNAENSYLTASAANIAQANISSLNLSYNQVASIIRITISGVPSGQTVTAVGMEFPSQVIPVVAAVTLSTGAISSVTTTASAQYCAVTGAVAASETKVDFAIFPHDYTSEGSSSDKISFYVETTDGSGIMRSYLIKSIDRRAFVQNTIYTLSNNISSVTPRNAYSDGSYSGFGVRPYGTKIWAPVNCGYHATNYKYGKLYQWGTNVWNGYYGNDNSGSQGFPTLVYRKSDNGNFYSNADYSGSTVSYTSGKICQNWAKDNGAPDGSWGGSSPYITKSASDPCPTGWRVPSREEFSEIATFTYSYSYDKDGNNTNSPDGVNGVWIGKNASSASKNNTYGCLFFSSAGYINGTGDGSNLGRNADGSYFTSTPSGNYAYAFCFDASRTGAPGMTSTDERGYAYSIRCVME